MGFTTDVSTCFNNLSTNSYESLFDEPFFKELKYLNDEYSAKFSLYTYNDVLANVPETYANEFELNCNWLKIGMHSNTNGLSLSNATYYHGLTYWNNFVSNIERICGSTNSIDRVPRLEFFSGSHNALFGMRDANFGALGFLSADDDRLSYYFNDDVMLYLYDHDYLNDVTNNLTFVSTDIRIDRFYNFYTERNYIKPVKPNIFEELEYRNETSLLDGDQDSLIIFTHEWLVYDGSNMNSKFDSIIDSCKFAKKYNIPFDYPQNKIYKPTSSDYLFKSIDTSKNVNLANRNFKCVSDIKDLSFSANKSINAVGTIVDAVGRATDINNVLSRVSNKTITLVVNTILENTIFYSLVEFKVDGSININGQTAKTWLTGSITLQSDTEYVLIAFKNGDGTTSFKDSALESLPKCITIN